MQVKPVFSIRDLVWLTIIVALAISLYLEYRRRVRIEHQLLDVRHFIRMKGFDIQTVTRDGGWTIKESVSNDAQDAPLLQP